MSETIEKNDQLINGPVQLPGTGGTGTVQSPLESTGVAKGSDITTGITIAGGQTKSVTQSNLSDDERKKELVSQGSLYR